MIHEIYVINIYMKNGTYVIQKNYDAITHKKPGLLISWENKRKLTEEQVSWKKLQEKMFCIS